MNTNYAIGKQYLRDLYSSSSEKDRLKSRIDEYFQTMNRFDQARSLANVSPAVRYYMGTHSIVTDNTCTTSDLISTFTWDKYERDHLKVQVEKLGHNLFDDAEKAKAVSLYIFKRGKIENLESFVERGNPTSRQEISKFLNKIRNGEFKTHIQKQYELTPDYKRKKTQKEIAALENLLSLQQIVNPVEEILGLLPKFDRIKQGKLSPNGTAIRNQFFETLINLENVCKGNQLKLYGARCLEDKNFVNILPDDLVSELKHIIQLITSFQNAKIEKAKIKNQIHAKKEEIGISDSSRVTRSVDWSNVENMGGENVRLRDVQVSSSTVPSSKANIVPPTPSATDTPLSSRITSVTGYPPVSSSVSSSTMSEKVESVPSSTSVAGYPPASSSIPSSTTSENVENRPFLTKKKDLEENILPSPVKKKNAFVRFFQSIFTWFKRMWKKIW